jgi:hypothetical protein
MTFDADQAGVLGDSFLVDGPKKMKWNKVVPIPLAANGGQYQ